MTNIKNCRYGPMMYLEQDTIKGRELSLYGEANFHEIEYFNNLINPDDVIIDIGAHIGTLSIPFGMMTGPNGKVIAIEAYSYLSHILEANVVLNDLHNITVLNAAVCDDSSKKLFEQEVQFDHTANFGSLKLSTTTGKPILSLTIDDLQLDQVNLIKIDVEGMESSVLKGARKTIKQHRPFLVVEFLNNLKEIIEFLKNLENYDCKMFQPPLFNENNFAGNPENVFPNICSFDLICYPKEQTIPNSRWFVGVPENEKQ